MNELKGKVAIVTGASTPFGIGNAIAKRFARARASVLCVAEATQEKLETVVRECRAFENSGRVESALIDLGEPGSPERMVQMARISSSTVVTSFIERPDAPAHKHCREIDNSESAHFHLSVKGC